MFEKYNNQKTLVTGGSGMVGSALRELIPEAEFVSSVDFNLCNEFDCETMFDTYEPNYVIHLAASVGGLKANTNYIADFYTKNVRINTNVLHYAHEFQTKKLVSVLSTCIYPDKARYPLTEDQILNGPPHKSNFGYAYAKRMQYVQSMAYRQQYGCNFITAVPSNIFGINDNFSLKDSHVIPAIMRKIYEAKIRNEDVCLWGSGEPLREFTSSKDIAKILLFLLDVYDGVDPINICNNKEYSIREIAENIAQLLDFKGNIIWDTDQPDGQLRKPSSIAKLLDLGWEKEDFTDVKITLGEVVDWFKENYPNVRGVNE